MAKLEKIWVHDMRPDSVTGGRYELRFDWDNDRHQAIALDDLGPDEVKEALLKMAHLLNKEQQNEYL